MMEISTTQGCEISKSEWDSSIVFNSISLEVSSPQRQNCPPKEGDEVKFCFVCLKVKIDETLALKERVLTLYVHL